MATEHSSPLSQFTIERIVPFHAGTVDLSYTNAALMMTIVVILITGFLLLAMRRPQLVPGRLQSIAELAYEFTARMVQDNLGPEGRAFFPFVFSLFMFLLLANLIALIPYSFSITAQLIVTVAFSLFVFVLVTVVAFIRHGFHFFKFFMPEGAPLLMAPLIVPIEIISYMARPVTLSIRLFANMMAGHTMMAVFGGFAIALGYFFFLPVLADIALYGLELIVAALQAYVFAILTVLYLRDAIHMH
ncbi:MAG TPA: F0F1 ATP synthase subunit A [Stellaceae bacterium]|nr:F0F1 ATP synthase subunit A [Stellaceae bacterium]